MAQPGFVEALNKAIENGFGHWTWIDNDPDLDSLRGTAAFKAIIARAPAEGAEGAA